MRAWRAAFRRVPGVDLVLADPLVRRIFWGHWAVYAVLRVVFKYERLGGGPWQYRVWGSLVTAAWQTGMWLLLCFAALALAARLPLDGRWLRSMGIVLLAGAAAALGWILLQRGIWCRFPLGVCSPAPVVWRIASTMCTAYVGLVGSGLALRYARRHGEQEIRERRMEAQLAEARLAALKMQLRPHFLFNTLQSVSTLMHRDGDAARAVLAGLRELLGTTLEREAQQEVPLGEELRVVELYAGIERVRFGERLRVELDVGPGLGGALVPHLLLQPLVENAIRHGVSRREPGRVRIEAAERGGELRLVVQDYGQGPTRPEPGNGVGLANTRARLEALYGGAHRFDISRGEAGGTAVTITLPLRFAPEGERCGHAEDQGAGR